MASKKVSELSELSEFSDSAYVPVVDGGVTYKMSFENLLQKTLRVDKSSEISSVTTKTIITDGDLIMLEDAASGNVKKKCTKSQFLHDVPQIVIAGSNPVSTPGKIGMFHINTADSRVYISKGTSSSDDWIEISNS